MTDTTTVQYEPAHDVSTVYAITEALASRGYALDSRPMLRYSPVVKTEVLYAFPDYSVEVHDGRLQLCTVDGETDLKPIEEFETPGAYASALADVLDAVRGL